MGEQHLLAPLGEAGFGLHSPGTSNPLYVGLPGSYGGYNTRLVKAGHSNVHCGGVGGAGG